MGELVQLPLLELGIGLRMFRFLLSAFLLDVRDHLDTLFYLRVKVFVFNLKPLVVFVDILYLEDEFFFFVE